jgi:hypothetical protein
MQRLRPWQRQPDRAKEVVFLEFWYPKSQVPNFVAYFLERLARSFSDQRAYSASSKLDFDFGT